MFKKLVDNVSFSYQNFRLRTRNKEDAKKYFTKFFIKLIIAIVKYAIVACIAFVFIYPFAYMVVTALKSPADLADPTVQWIPTTIWRDNFELAIEGLRYGTTIKNSIIVTILSTIGHVISAALAGYAISRYNFKFRNILVLLLVFQIIMPPQVIAIPSFIVFSKLGILRTYLPIVLPSFFGAGIKGGIYIFIFRQFYLGIPKELEEAARVDGCGALSTFTRIILPMSKAPFLVTTVLSMVWHWTDNYESVLYIQDTKLRLVISYLPELYSILSMEAETSDDWAKKMQYTEGVVMAATLLIVLPILVVYFFLQRQFTQGVERSGIVG